MSVRRRSRSILASLLGNRPKKLRRRAHALRVELLESRCFLAAQLVISEFMADNNGLLQDGNGNAPDWIEVHNSGDAAVDLLNYRLTDNADNLLKWVFPSRILAPDEYLTVFASGQDADNFVDQAGNLHTNFKLGRNGEYVALVSPAGAVISEYGSNGADYPPQLPNVSYGVAGDDPGVVGYMPTATPESANVDSSEVFAGFVAETQFSGKRGFYSEPQWVEITTATPGALSYYTTNGSPPLPNDPAATRYTDALLIDSTTTLRAAAFKAGMVPANIATHTYIFVEDVIRQDEQSTLAAGFPQTWGGATPDYGLDPAVVGQNGEDRFQGLYANTIRDDLKALPALSMVLDIDDVFGDQGIYTNASQEGAAWERPTSVELLHADGTKDFQVDAGVRIQGGVSRELGRTRKKSFRILFKNIYGAGKLDNPLFGDDAVHQFDTLTLRMDFNDGWAGTVPSEAQYARDEFGRRTQLAIGQPASHGRHVHLYINGVYWGMYNLVERPDTAFAASYFGGDKDQWDGLNAGTPTNSGNDPARAARTMEAWRTMNSLAADVSLPDTQEERTAALQVLQGNFADGTDDPDRPSFLDVDNYIDYLIAGQYVANQDWGGNNYYAARENTPYSTGFKFFTWDAEVSLGDPTTNLLKRNGGVLDAFQHLRLSKEFRVRFGDRVQRQIHEGGALYVDPEHPHWDPDHPERNVPAARYVQLTQEIFAGIVGESARWGDHHRSEFSFVRDQEWQDLIDQHLMEWFPNRTANLLQQYRDARLYPKIDAPLLSHRGGTVADGYELVISNPVEESTIYYTLDGSDPRLVGGDVNPDARVYDGTPLVLHGDVHIRARLYQGTKWSAIEDAFYVTQAPAIANGDVSAEQTGALQTIHRRLDETELPAAAAMTVDTLLDEADGSVVDGDISLRDAIAAAAAGATIDFDGSLDGGKIMLTQGELVITRSLVIDAGSLAEGLTIDASGNDPTPAEANGDGSRVFYMDVENGASGSAVTIHGLTLTGGDVQGDGGAIWSAGDVTITGSTIRGNSATVSGGGIRALGDVMISTSTIAQNSAIFGGGLRALGTTTVDESTISGNSATSGGGVNNYGAVTVTGSTIAENTARITGGGFHALDSVTVTNSTVAENQAERGAATWGREATVAFSTVSGNSAVAEGGGLYAYRRMTVTSSIVAGNVDADIAPDLHPPFGALTVRYSLIGSNTGTRLAEVPLGMPDAKGNLIGDPTGMGAIDAMLSPLANHGGARETHALLPGSPAIDAGDPSFTAPPDFDQRGSPFARVVGPTIDLGAFELQVAGDLNFSGGVDSSDIDAFVLALAQPRSYQTRYGAAPSANGDLDGDGDFDFDDITGFVDQLKAIRTSIASVALTPTTLVNPHAVDKTDPARQARR